MKVSIQDLGILKQAEFEVGDLTIICGSNNTGKTYATYALYGFICYWNEAYEPDLLKEEHFKELIEEGSVRIELDDIQRNTKNIIDDACKEYKGFLPMVFAAPDKHFDSTIFNVSLGDMNFIDIEKSIQSTGPNRKLIINLSKNHGDNHLSVGIKEKSEEIDEVNEKWIFHQVNRNIQQILFGDVFTIPFIASIERTGASIFRKELDFTRNRLLEHVSNREKNVDPFVLIGTYYDRGYALPVNRDVDFNRGLEDAVKNESFISKNHPDIIEAFDLILGGEYRASKEGLYYIPNNSRIKLTMGESASSVRSLLNVGIYIRHIAKPGDILMIDEPELNLHPMNQRRIARVLAKLVNVGIRVFITTHSDYIVKEFNTLIMLNNTKSIEQRNRVIKKYNYQDNEFLDPDKIKAYNATKAMIKIEGKSKKQKRNTFILANIDEYGIEIDEFDDTINIMNNIQEELMFGIE